MNALDADEDDETDDDVIHEYKKEETKDLGVSVTSWFLICRLKNFKINKLYGWMTP